MTPSNLLLSYSLPLEPKPTNALGEHALPSQTMRPIFLTTLLALAGCAAFADGATEGRRGMERYQAGDYENAAVAFQEGIDATENQTGRTRQALYTDLGLANFAQAQFVEAAEAFTQALSLAETPSRRAEAAYNAGTALANTEELERALSHLRRALILQPDFPAARFNYELVKRRLEGTQPPDGTPPEPSAFAEELKNRADALVASHRYHEAANLMNDGLLQDSTVAAYGDFMQRLGEVVEIEEMDTPTDPDSAQ